jgi:hypothetical protein
MPTRDYFAEMYVAGVFADAGWNVYFPRRDKGFDFIVSKPDGDGGQILRPAQVKGKYPTSAKTDKTVYGFNTKLSQVHPEMVLAIPYFPYGASPAPTCIAYIPRSLIKASSRGYRCSPASFKKGVAAPRRQYQKFFDETGLSRLESPEWSNSKI